MSNDKKYDSFDGGMVIPPQVSAKKKGRSSSGEAALKKEKNDDYAFEKKPVKKNITVKPAHDPERFNRVLKEAEKVKEPASVLIDPEIIARIAIVFIFLLIYILFFR